MLGAVLQRACLSVLAAVALFGFFGAAPAGAAAGYRLTPVRADKPFALDASFADPRWAEAIFAGGFTDLGTRAPARFKTEVALFYDDANLYVAFRAEQRVALTATQRTNNIGFGVDDFVGFEVDTAGNAQQPYIFETTPLGTRYQQAGESARYLPEWHAAAVATQNGWNALLVVPLRILKIPGNGPQHWRINFIRATVAANEHDTWAYNGLMGDDVAPNWPFLAEAKYWPISSGIALRSAVSRPQPRAEFYALDAAGAGHNEFVNPFGVVTERRAPVAGVDLSYPLTPSISAVAAIDPDFSSVETDQQTIAPQQFQRNFNEYRTFFAQGANFINTNIDGFAYNLPLDRLFYSPSLGAIDRGIKVEGTAGIRSFGLLEAHGSDPATGSFDDLAWGFLQRRTSNTLALWSEGVLANHAGARDASYEVGGFGRSLASGLVYGAQYGREDGSFVVRPSDAQQARAFIDIQRNGFEGAISYQDIGPQYHPIDGFTSLADIRGPDGFFDFVRNTSSWSKFKNVELYANVDRWTDRSGAVHSADADYFLTLRTKHAQRIVLGQQLGSLREYGGDSYSGYPNGYTGAVTQPFAYRDLEMHLGDGTPRSLTTTYLFGTFGSFFLNQFGSTIAAQLGGGKALSFDYAGTRERPFVSGPADGQWLRRVALALPFGSDGNASLSYRVISGTGGFAAPGRNLALSLRRRFTNGNELFVNYGTPAADKTLDRWIVKYLIRMNGGV